MATTKTKELAGLNPKVRDFLSAVIYGYGAGAPGTGEGQGRAPKGSLYIDTANGVLYKNTGSKATPSWNSVGTIATAEIDDSAVTTAKIADSNVTSAKIADSNVTAAKIADGVLTGAKAATVADDNVVGGLPVVHRIVMASGADANADVTLTHKTRIIDAWFVLKGAGTAGSTVSIADGTNTIVTAIDVSAGGDKDIFRAAEIDDAYHEIAAAGTLRAAHASTGGDFPGAECYVLAVRVA